MHIVLPSCVFKSGCKDVCMSLGQSGYNLIPDLERHAHVRHLVCLQIVIAFGWFGPASRLCLHPFKCSCASRTTPC